MSTGDVSAWKNRSSSGILLLNSVNGVLPCETVLPVRTTRGRSCRRDADGRTGCRRHTCGVPLQVTCPLRLQRGKAVSIEDNKRVVANFVEVCQNQHDLAAADEIFHPDFVNHYDPAGHAIPPTPRPAGGFQWFYGMLLRAFPDATMEINEQLGERDF